MLKNLFTRLALITLCLLCSITGAETYTTTTNYAFQLPQVNNVIDQNLWGAELNTNFSNLDSLLLTATNTVVATTLNTTALLTNANQNQLINADATSAPFTITLQAAATAGTGFRVTFKKTDSSANAVTVKANASENIDTANTYVLTTQNQTITIVSDGTQWWVVVPVPPTVATATSSSQGIVQPDNSTITISGGILSATKQGITLGTATAFNSATSYNVTGLPSGIKQLTINLQNVSVSGSANILFQIGDATGGLKTSGYNSTSGLTGSGGGSQAPLTSTSGMTLDGIRALMNGSITFNLLDATNFIWVATYIVTDQYGDINYGSGQVTISGPIDQITFTTVGGAGSWTAGKINIFYQ